jgi:hypothetical protein
LQGMQRQPFKPVIGHTVVSKPILAGGFLLLSLFLLPFNHYFLNPDGIAYLRIASYYAEGDFSAAVNAYWSPLLSWLLAPFFAMGLPWVISFHVLNIIIAGICLWKWHQVLANCFADLSVAAKNGFLLASTFLLVSMVYTVVTPDLLVLCLLLFLLYELLSGNILTKPVATGITGALLFFAKAYCFYFFIAFIVLYVLVDWYRNRFRSLPIKQLLMVSVAFLLPVAAWMTVMQQKYKVWQVSSAPAYNYAIIDAHGRNIHPFDTTYALLPLPYEKAYCLWEDPQATYHYQLPSKKASWHLLMIKANLLRTWQMVTRYAQALLLCIPFVIFIRRQNKNGALFGDAYRSLVLVTMLYVSGYLLIIVEHRYIYLLLFVMLLLLYKCFDLVIAWRRSVVTLALPVLLTSYVFFVSTRSVVNRWGIDKDVYGTVQKIGVALPAGSRIVTWHTRDLWNQICTFNLHNYGSIASYKTWDSLYEGLEKYKIDYLVLDMDDVEQIPVDIRAHLSLYRTVDNVVILTWNNAGH